MLRIQDLGSRVAGWGSAQIPGSKAIEVPRSLELRPGLYNMLRVY